MDVLSLKVALSFAQIFFYSTGTLVVFVGAVLALRRYVLEDPHAAAWTVTYEPLRIVERQDGTDRPPYMADAPVARAR